jgi:hypothetical protein
MAGKKGQGKIKRKYLRQDGFWLCIFSSEIKFPVYILQRWFFFKKEPSSFHPGEEWASFSEKSGSDVVFLPQSMASFGNRSL